MTLDIHLARSAQAATRKPADLRLELEVHAAIFAQRNADGTSLDRLHDYYRDASFGLNDLASLQQGIEVAAASNRSVEAAGFLTEFRALVERAVREQKSVFVFAD